MYLVDDISFEKNFTFDSRCVLHCIAFVQQKSNSVVCYSLCHFYSQVESVFETVEEEKEEESTLTSKFSQHHFT